MKQLWRVASQLPLLLRTALPAPESNWLLGVLPGPWQTMQQHICNQCHQQFWHLALRQRQPLSLWQQAQREEAHATAAATWQQQQWYHQQQQQQQEAAPVLENTTAGSQLKAELPPLDCGEANLQQPWQHYQHDRRQQQPQMLYLDQLQHLPATFDALGVPQRLITVLQQSGVATSTPVQAAAMQPILAGRHIAVQSPTGSGKTLAYLLPLLTRLRPWAFKTRTKKPQVLVIAPTQELCMQVLRVARHLVPSHTKSILPVVGGANPARQREALVDHKPCMLVGTPGRLVKVWQKIGPRLGSFSPLPTLLPLPEGQLQWQQQELSQQLADQQQFELQQHDGGNFVQHTGKPVLVLEEADKLMIMDDFKELLAMLQAQYSPGSQSVVSARRAADINSSSQPSPMKTILGNFQVVLVSASINHKTLAASSVWVGSNPVMITSRHSMPAAASSQWMQQQQAGMPPQPRAAEIAGVMQTGLARNAEQPSLSDSLAKLKRGSHKYQKKAELQQAIQMMPSNLQHQVCTYEDRMYRLERTLLQLLVAYVSVGKKVLIIPGAGANVAELHYNLSQMALNTKDVHRCHHLWGPGWYQWGVPAEQQGGSALQVFHTHGNHPANWRMNTLRKFNNGEVRVLVVTDAFSQGLDFKDVDVVIQAKALAPSLKNYAHRAGRAGRMGRPGTMLSVIPKERLGALKAQIRKLKVQLQEVEIVRSAGKLQLMPRAVLETQRLFSDAGAGRQIDKRHPASQRM